MPYGILPNANHWATISYLQLKNVMKKARKFVLVSSEIGHDRPLYNCSFSRDASMLSTKYLLLIIRNHMWFVRVCLGQML